MIIVQGASGQAMTPIEKKMDDALHVYIGKLLPLMIPFGWHLDVCREVKFGPYRVDFVLLAHCLKNTGVMLIVECDGHKWHNLTPQQVSYDRKRDRWFVANGLNVIRFPGRDIWENANNMAHQAWTILFSNLASLLLRLPSTGEIREGIINAHSEIKQLATEAVGVQKVWRN